MQRPDRLIRVGVWGACLWPGLPRLWQGDAGALCLAVALSAGLNGLLIVSLIAPYAVGGLVLGAGWLLLGTSWIIGIWWSARRIWGVTRQGGAQEDLFLQAQAQYLRGHWFEAQAVLKKLLADNPRDVEAHLMLATLYRRIGRSRDARRQLRMLRQIDGADKWQCEMDEEWRRLEHLRSRLPTTEAGPRDAGDPTCSEAA